MSQTIAAAVYRVDPQTALGQVRTVDRENDRDFFGYLTIAFQAHRLCVFPFQTKGCVLAKN